MNYVRDYWINKTTNDLTDDLKQYEVPGFGRVQRLTAFPVEANNGTLNWGVQFNEFEANDKAWFLVHNPKDETWGVNQLAGLLYKASASRDDAIKAFFDRLQEIPKNRRRNIAHVSKDYLRAVLRHDPEALSEEEKKEFLPAA